MKPNRQSGASLASLASAASGASAAASAGHMMPGHACPHDFSPLHPVQHTCPDWHVIVPHGTPGPLSEGHAIAVQ